jgi:uncharacterized protein (TIGR00730 family)
VFCGSNPGRRAEFADAARAMGRCLARRKLELVYGGGCVGLMGILADEALAAGAKVHGVIPRALATREVAHYGLTQLVVVESMHARKAAMAELSDAFVALPGGLGTFDELFEIATWAQLGIHAKPIGVLDVAGYFEPLRSLLAHAVDAGFVRPEHRDLLHVAADPDLLLDLLEITRRPQMSKWRIDGEAPEI